MVDATDLKSVDLTSRASSSLAIPIGNRCPNRYTEYATIQLDTMETLIKWSVNSGDVDAEAKLMRIAEWWQNLAGQEIIWQQREVTASQSASDLDWQLQKFDERFYIQAPTLKGITLYWRKPDQPPNQDDRNLTVSALELDLFNQTLIASPASGRNYLIKVTVPRVVFQKIELANPQISVLRQPDGSVVLLCRDEVQKLEVQINLSAGSAIDLVAQL